ncbi:hypothetical protein EDD68_10778 [Melghiribacillus thermohalophilus]|uniref:DnaD/phage-associated family protein n=1 Tax=Melghiribacillus thermohalophilus TaxID=1324956 RepID=A0A4R3N3N6_9BACI|nr:primosomal replication protein N [Melghiribacillus thermohalophilus]TCT23364.1 hypothetical protein EDD68_10778 [Melghiribacillus thermohalophilus]
MKTGNAVVDQIGKLNFTGNIIPVNWFKHITFDSGKPHVAAVMILSEICYWYRPTVVRDEATGQIVEVRKKFKADMLQRDYTSFAQQYGFSKRQVKLAMDKLEDMQLIRRAFRTIEKNGTKINNVLFVEPVPENIDKITFYDDPYYIQMQEGGTSECNTSYIQMQEPPTTECKTNTKTTTEITTETTLDVDEENAREVKQSGNSDEPDEVDEIARKIEEVYLTRKQSLHPSPKDLQLIWATAQNVAEENIDLQKVIDWIHASFDQYKPKYRGDKIHSFGYVDTYIRHQIHLLKEREKLKKTGGGNLDDAKHSGSDGGLPEKKATPSEETRRLERIAREKGLIPNGTIRDIDVDF